MKCPVHSDWGSDPAEHGSRSMGLECQPWHGWRKDLGSSAPTGGRGVQEAAGRMERERRIVRLERESA